MFTRLTPPLALCLLICMSAPGLTKTTADARNPLCPPPPSKLDDQPKKPLTAADYHAAMTKALISGDKLDWVEDDAANACGGYYQAPDNPNPQKNLKPVDADMHISAEAVNHSSSGFSEFSGNVEIYQGSTRLRCDSMRYSQSQNIGEIEGNIQLRETDVLLKAESMRFDGNMQQAQLHNSEYVLNFNNIHGTAQLMDFDNSSGGFLAMDDATFTACPPNKEHWAISAGDLDLDKAKGWGTAKHGFFYIEGVPVMYLPYLDFPIDDRRKTGILFPSLSSAKGGGIDVALPIYFNLAPNYDMTYIPRYNHDHGTLHGIETRYLNRFSEWAVSGTYIHDDKLIGDTETKNNTDIDSSRWLGSIKEHGRFNANWSTYIDYTAVSDINYFRDWGDVGLDIKKTLNIKREAQLNYQDTNWLVKSSLVDYQQLQQRTLPDGTTALEEEEYQHWPRIDVNFLDKSKPFTLTPIYLAQYTYFNHDTRERGHRLYNAPGLSFPMLWTAFKVVPSASIKRSDFDFKERQDKSSIRPTDLNGRDDITVGSFNIDAKMMMEREFSLIDSPFIHTLTPRLFYVYTGYQEDQEELINFDTTETTFNYNQLFRDSRFVSYDRIDDANQLTIAAETELLDGASGSSLISFGIGQILYFRDREVVLNANDNVYREIQDTDTDAAAEWKTAQNRLIYKKYFRSSSDIAMTARWTLDAQQSINGTMLWDPYDAEGEEGSIGYHYQNKAGYIFNAGYRYKKDLPVIIPAETDGTGAVTKEASLFNNNTNQVDVSFFVPIARDWRLFARANYDLGKSEHIDNITGLQYDGCCIGMMFAYQNERKTFSDNETIPEYEKATYEHTWYFQFEFKGLGALSSSLSRVLNEQIQGYQQREYND